MNNSDLTLALQLYTGKFGFSIPHFQVEAQTVLARTGIQIQPAPF